MFLVKHDPRYVECMERRREALVSHQEVDSEEIKPIVSERYYHDIFVKEFNIHFRSPRSDTCDKCDSLHINIEAAESDGDKAQLEQELQAHLMLAENGYASLRKDCEMSKQSWSQARTAANVEC